MPDDKYVASRYLVIVELDGGASFCGHAVYGQRRLLDPLAIAFVRLFGEPRTIPSGVEEAVEMKLFPSTGEGFDPERARHVLSGFARDLCSRHLLVPADEDEVAAVAGRLRSTHRTNIVRAFGLDAMEDAFEPVLPEPLADRATTGELEPVKFLLLGWCFTQSVRPVLQAEARRRGIEATVEVAFPEDLHLIADIAPDVTVLQLSHRALLAPILDPFYRLPQRELEERLQRACDEIRRAIGLAIEKAGDGLVLVQGIAAPQTSPFGLADHRQQLGFFEAVARLNGTARSALALHQNCLLIDEEALLSSHGKRYLLDDLVSTYSHHGVPEEEEGEGGAEGGPGSLMLQSILARAYLDAYEAAVRRGAIRVVAVDLDGTLWPGEIADTEFGFESDELTVPLMYGRFGGLHQALKILRERGILLAVVSKNERENVLSKWRPESVPLAFGVKREETGHYLAPDDFTVLKIDWRRKSEMLEEIIAELGITREQLAFIDDNPIERAEVRSALPGVLVLGDDMDRVREALLTSPRFQVPELSEEARRRTETTKARLAREEAERAATSHEEFLASLGVRCTIRSEHDDAQRKRISELLHRTHQFNTTGLELSPSVVAEMESREGCAVLSLEVADRFAEYGLVGVAIVDGPEVTGFALSCRVLGLEAEVTLLKRALIHAGRRGERAIVRFTRTDRNLPATRLFQVPGFERLADGSGYIYDVDKLGPPGDPAHCRVLDG